MIIALILTAVVWVVFAFKMDRSPNHDYAFNFMPILQVGLAVIVTLAIWLVYFALT